MPLRKILFLISLPDSSQFSHDREEVEECVCELRNHKVEVREHIWKEDLHDANNFDFVIIVAHHDSEAGKLVLSDGTMTLMELAEAVPDDFKGVIDLASCHSEAAAELIKQRCPQCRVQMALKDVPLLRRLVIYPFLAQWLIEEPSMDYREAYECLSNLFGIMLDKNVGTESSHVRMTTLGKRMTSIYAPKTVVRNIPFRIYFFLHYDADRKLVKLTATQWQTDMRYQQELPVLLENYDEIQVKISFSADKNQILLTNGGYTRIVKVNNGVTTVPFVVNVTDGFLDNDFYTNILLSKEGKAFLSCSFSINVGSRPDNIPADIFIDKTDYSYDNRDIILGYKKIYSSNILGKNAKYHFSFYDTRISNMNDDNETAELLDDIRRSLWVNSFYFNQTQEVLNKIQQDINKIQDNEDHNSDLFLKLLPRFSWFSWNLKHEFDWFKDKSRFWAGKTFNEVKNEFILFETRYTDFLAEVLRLKSQVTMLDEYVNLRDLIRKVSNAEENAVDADIITEIKNHATRFFKQTVDWGTDKELFDIFKEGGIKSIVSAKTQGEVTMNYLALIIAMACGEFVSIDYRNEDWMMNVTKFIDLKNYDGSLRMPKLRILRTISILDKKEIREMIRRYQCTKEGTISIASFLLLKIKLSINKVYK